MKPCSEGGYCPPDVANSPGQATLWVQPEQRLIAQNLSQLQAIRDGNWNRGQTAMNLRMLKALAVATTVLTAGSAQAITLNLDAGFDRFNFGSVGTLANRVFTFTLSGFANLTVVDGYVSGDRFEILSNGTSRGLTRSGVDDVSRVSNRYDEALTNPDFSSRVYRFGPGSYSISILVNHRAPTETRGLAAVRLDTAPVPVPAAGLTLVTALGAVAALRRRRKSA